MNGYISELKKALDGVEITSEGCRDIDYTDGIDALVRILKS